MKKKEIANMVLKDGKPLDPTLYVWDKNTNIFSSNESGLFFDCKNIDNCTFKTGNSCTFITGEGCTFNTGWNCMFDTGGGCTFNTGGGCTFNTVEDCTFNTGWSCTFNTGGGCTFNTGWSCTFNTGGGCTFNTVEGCTFKTGGGCTFNTGEGCTFNTGWNCTFNTGGGCTLPFPPIHFTGSQYFIEFSKPGHIRSGCIEKPVTWWEENIVRCAEEHNYTPEQIKEYQLYVSLIVQWMKANNLYEVK